MQRSTRVSLGRLIMETYTLVDEAESLEGDGSSNSLKGIAAAQSSILFPTATWLALAA